MGISKAYLTSFKNLKPILAAIQSAQAPSRFTTRFLEGLGFKSPPDRLIIGVLKGLGFLSAGGEPTKRYFDYLDQTQSARVLAEAIREAYADLFQVNVKANELSQSDVKNKLKTLTQGQASESVLGKMAATFKGLSGLADFAVASRHLEVPREQAADQKAGASLESSPRPEDSGRVGISGLVYNIQIVLPESRDSAVFDALFKSMKEHLLR